MSKIVNTHFAVKLSGFELRLYRIVPLLVLDPNDWIISPGHIALSWSSCSDCTELFLSLFWIRMTGSLVLVI